MSPAVTSKSRSIDPRLAGLEQRREQLAAKARKIKVKLAEYDTDRRIRGEMTTHNPYQADYDKAAAALAPVEEELTAFKQKTLGQRVADAIDTDDAARQIREAGAQLLEALGRYRADADTALQLVLDVYPRGGGRRVQPDPRVDGWAEVARTIAAAEIQPVTVNTDPMARYR